MGWFDATLEARLRGAAGSVSGTRVSAFMPRSVVANGPMHVVDLELVVEG